MMKITLRGATKLAVFAALLVGTGCHRTSTALNLHYANGHITPRVSVAYDARYYYSPFVHYWHRSHRYHHNYYRPRYVHGHHGHNYNRGRGHYYNQGRGHNNGHYGRGYNNDYHGRNHRRHKVKIKDRTGLIQKNRRH